MVEKHKTLSRIHVPLISLAFSLVLFSATLVSLQTTSAEGLPQCGNFIQIVNPAPGQVVDDTFPLELHNNNNNPGAPINSVKFFIDDDNIGSATQDTVTPGFWRLLWDTTSTDNDDYDLTAEVQFGSGGGRCVTDEQQMLVDNQGGGQTSDLEIQISPDEWLGPTNVNFEFEAFAILEDGQGGFTDVTNNASFTWSTTIGTINGVNYSGDFFSGPTPGIGEVSVTAQYGGQVEEVSAFVNVSAGQGDFSYPDPDDEDGTHNESGQDEERRAGQGQSQVQGDQELASCIRERLGEDTYRSLIADRKRLDATQFETARTCFAQRQFVIPSNLAPVNPNDVRNLQEYSRLQISEVKNTTNAEGEVGLELSGTTDPDASVLIYIFSEPLVLTAQADSDGRWSYTLDDPLAPGDHEAYVLVENDGEFKRSGVFAFAIAQGQQTSDNPSGNGLTLATAGVGDQNTTIYIAGVAVVVLLASVFLTRFVWFKKAGGVDDSNENNQKLDDSTGGDSSSNRPVNAAS